LNSQKARASTIKGAVAPPPPAGQQRIAITIDRAGAPREVVTMSSVSRDPDLGRIPEGYRWCPHCDGYGSSLNDANDRCAKCNGTGLVAADRRDEAAASPTNGASATPR
jgi:hypothetical protein